ncbi:MAG: hypothetical protein V2B20_22555 [Pseudomonadota bacterium]
MSKHKGKLAAAKKAEKEQRRKEYMTIFINGKQKQVRRPSTTDGIGVEEFILRNADPIWLHQNEMWEYIDIKEEPQIDIEDREISGIDKDEDYEIPF